jgi:hypothetical protein
MKPQKQVIKRRVVCKNGNAVERFYERTTRSHVVVVKDAEGNQLGDADYSGNVISMAHMFHTRINENGGAA